MRLTDIMRQTIQGLGRPCYVSIDYVAQQLSSLNASDADVHIDLQGGLKGEYSYRTFIKSPSSKKFFVDSSTLHDKLFKGYTGLHEMNALATHNALQYAGQLEHQGIKTTINGKPLASAQKSYAGYSAPPSPRFN